MSRREEAVDSCVTVQVLMTTTSGVSPAWARSNPRAPRDSRACSLSAWLSRQPRVLKATLGLWTAAFTATPVGLPSRFGGPGTGGRGSGAPWSGGRGSGAPRGSGSDMVERLHQRGLDRVTGLGGGVDADEPGAGEHRAPVVLLGEQLVPGVAGLGPVPAQGPVGLLGHRRGVDHAGELVVGGAAAAVGVVLPRQHVAAGPAHLPPADQVGDGHAPVVEAGL